jgi:hypothetical protein
MWDPSSAKIPNGFSAQHQQHQAAGDWRSPKRHFLVFPDLHLSEFSTYFGIFSISAICTFVP